MPKQEKIVRRRWNEEEDLERWERYYYEDSHHGNKVRSREKILLEFLDSLKLKKNSKILELGYGAGITSSKILKRSYNLTGIDISRPLQKIAIKNCRKIKNAKFNLLIGNAEELNFKDNSFDCVVGLGFMQYLDNPKKCVKEVYRVLKPRGYLILAQTNMYGISKMDSIPKLIRTLIYLITQKRYEIRYTDKLFLYPLIGFSELTYKIFPEIKRLRHELISHKKTGSVKRNNFSIIRLRKLLERNNFKVIKQKGAGYRTKKAKYFPKTAKKIDNYLQKISDKKDKTAIHNIGTSIVLLAKKN